MKKARNVFLFALVLLSVISMGSVAGTYAKYTSNSSFTDQARVAKWDIKLNNNQMTQNFTIDLFKTVNKDTDGSDETDVKEGTTTEKIIAPGTQGEFTFNIKNDSEVNANVKMDWTGYNNDDNIPIKFKGTITAADGTVTSTDWLDDITSILTTPTALEMTKTVSVKVEWKWDYEADDVDAGDVVDTTLGETGTAVVIVAGKVVATQVD